MHHDLVPFLADGGDLARLRKVVDDEGLRYVAAAFADTGTVVSLEFMPFANISTLASALDLVQRADHPNVGLMLDLWHLVRSSTPMQEVAQIPLRYISAVELNDGPAQQEGDGYEDTVLRALCAAKERSR